MSMGEELTTSPNDVCVLLLVLALWLWVVFITDILILCPIASHCTFPSTASSRCRVCEGALEFSVVETTYARNVRSMILVLRTGTCAREAEAGTRSGMGLELIGCVSSCNGSGGRAGWLRRWRWRYGKRQAEHRDTEWKEAEFESVR